MPSGAPGARNHDGERVGGARADFIASLGRKLNDARELLRLLEEDPSSKASRDELRRRLHALGAGARLLQFDAMTHAIREVLALLDRGAETGELPSEQVDFVAQVLDDLPALAWGEVPPREHVERDPSDRGREASSPMSIAALVVGGKSLADALGKAEPSPSRAFECERTEDPDKALQLARAYAPDLVVVDADMPRAPELVEALLDDPLTDPVPVVVLGTFHSPDQLSRFVALGVTRTLAKPVSAELLRATCDEIVDTRDERTVRLTLGEPTLEQLADRLSDDMRRALIDSVDRPARTHRVPLGEGTEVLAALWGAIARVQEIVSRKTGGAIHFHGGTPEGAIALAPWLHQDLPGVDRLAGRGRGAAADVRLNGRRVVVADDDPAVTWFISDLLRRAGCVVHEALDGTTALELAFRFQPELVISDILMPGIDGFALCRALRRDVALRDTPVILLSWKEDLLQRVRELGASAAAYLRKESGSRAILARVREVLRPRARIELRLRSEGEVRGRLDGLTPRLLLELVCGVRKDARISVRDAAHLFEVEVRAGTPRRATRTASDGSYQSGERALASLLGVGAGRFVVTSSSEPIHGDLTDTLSNQLFGPIARARGALGAIAGTRMTAVERIGFDPRALEPYLAATPEPIRSLIERLALGATPRQILLSGEASPSLLEDVLSDLAARGAIQAVEGQNGMDILTPAVEAALSVMRGAPEPRRSLPPDGQLSASTPTASFADSRPAAANPSRVPPEAAFQSTEGEPSLDFSDAAEEAVPSSLEDAVMREISGRSLELRSSRAPTSDRPPIIEPRDLRRRSSNPPESSALAESRDQVPVATPIPPAPTGPTSIPSPSIPPLSLPPDAMVPATSNSEEDAPGPATQQVLLGGAAPVVATDTRDLIPRAATSDPDPLEPLPLRGRRGLVLTIASLVLLVVAVLVWTNLGDVLQPAPAEAPTAPQSIGPTASVQPVVRALAPASIEDNLPPGAEVPPGFGLVEVRVPAPAVVRIDGTIVGSGPFVANVVAPGFHEVGVELSGRRSTQVIDVRVGTATRVVPTLPP